MPPKTDASRPAREAAAHPRAPGAGLVVLALALGVLGVLGGLSLALNDYVNPALPITVAAIGGACLLAGAFGVGGEPSARWALLAVAVTVLGAWAICAYAPPAVVVFGEPWPVPLYDGLPQPLAGVWPQEGVASQDAAAPVTSDLLYPPPRDYYPCWYGQVALPFWPLVSAALTVVAVWLGWRAWPRGA